MSTEYTVLSVSALSDKKTDEVSEKIKELEKLDSEIQSLQIQIEKAIAILQQGVVNKTLTTEIYNEQAANIDSLENKLYEKNNDYLEKRKNLNDLMRKNRKLSLQQINQTYAKRSTSIRISEFREENTNSNSPKRSDSRNVSNWKSEYMTISSHSNSPIPSIPSPSSSSSINKDIPNMWNIEENDLTLFKEAILGKGQFGTVYRGRLLGKDVAVKQFHEQNLSKEVLDEFKQEVKIMSSLRHPNIILFLGSITKPGKLSVVTEIMARGSVYELLHPEKGECELSFKRRILIAKECAQGMNWLHNMQPAFLHLDLKTANILVDENWTAKVSDFGLSQMRKQQHIGKRGSPTYMSPEMLLNKVYGAKSDVYSFAIILWELMTMKIPYLNRFSNFEEMVASIGSNNERPPFPADAPKKMKDLISACWDADPEERPSFDDMLRINAFDVIIIEGLIDVAHDIARKMWKDKFLGKYSIDWRDFLVEFMKTLNITYALIPADDVKWQLLKNVLGVDTQLQVTVENFARFLEWFGPFELGPGIMERVYRLTSKNYFHGFLSTQQAENALISRGKIGSFLVRFSTSEPGAFSVSVLCEKNEVTHYRITHKPFIGFVFGNQQFKSIDEILNATKVHKTMKPPMSIKSPLTPTPYSELLKVASKSESGQIPSNQYASFNQRK